MKHRQLTVIFALYFFSRPQNCAFEEFLHDTTPTMTNNENILEWKGNMIEKQFGTLYDYPKRSDRDCGLEFFTEQHTNGYNFLYHDDQPCRRLDKWYLVKLEEDQGYGARNLPSSSCNSLRYPLPCNQKLLASFQLHGVLIPSGKLSNLSSVHVVLNNLKFWIFDSTPLSEGFWVSSAGAWYNLKRPCEKKITVRVKVQSEQSTTAILPSQADHHISISAKFGLLLNIIDLFSENCKIKTKKDVKLLISQIVNDPEESTSIFEYVKSYNEICYRSSETVNFKLLEISSNFAKRFLQKIDSHSYIDSWVKNRLESMVDQSRANEMLQWNNNDNANSFNKAKVCKNNYQVTQGLQRATTSRRKLEIDISSVSQVSVQITMVESNQKDFDLDSGSIKITNRSSTFSSKYHADAQKQLSPYLTLESGIDQAKLDDFINTILSPTSVHSLEYMLICIKELTGSTKKVLKTLFKKSAQGGRIIFIDWFNYAYLSMKQRRNKNPSSVFTGEETDEMIVCEIMNFISNYVVIKEAKQLEVLKTKYDVDWFTIVIKTLVFGKDKNLTHIIASAEKALHYLTVIAGEEYVKDCIKNMELLSDSKFNDPSYDGVESKANNEFPEAFKERLRRQRIAKMKEHAQNMSAQRKHDSLCVPDSGMSSSETYNISSNGNVNNENDNVQDVNSITPLKNGSFSKRSNEWRERTKKERYKEGTRTPDTFWRAGTGRTNETRVYENTNQNKSTQHHSVRDYPKNRQMNPSDKKPERYEEYVKLSGPRPGDVGLKSNLSHHDNKRKRRTVVNSSVGLHENEDGEVKDDRLKKRQRNSSVRNHNFQADYRQREESNNEGRVRNYRGRNEVQNEPNDNSTSIIYRHSYSTANDQKSRNHDPVGNQGRSTSSGDYYDRNMKRNYVNNEFEEGSESRLHGKRESRHNERIANYEEPKTRTESNSTTVGDFNSKQRQFEEGNKKQRYADPCYTQASRHTRQIKLPSNNDFGFCEESEAKFSCGMGRGRHVNLPAWMTSSDSNSTGVTRSIDQRIDRNSSHHVHSVSDRKYRHFPKYEESKLKIQDDHFKRGGINSDRPLESQFSKHSREGTGRGRGRGRHNNLPAWMTSGQMSQNIVQKALVQTERTRHLENGKEFVAKKGSSFSFPHEHLGAQQCVHRSDSHAVNHEYPSHSNESRCNKPKHNDSPIHQKGGSQASHVHRGENVIRPDRRKIRDNNSHLIKRQNSDHRYNPDQIPGPARSMGRGKHTSLPAWLAKMDKENK